jgi:Bacterial membrane protein YfhO
LGNPVYGDMQSGAWNPVVWLFSAIGRYDLTLFHYENLLYIFLGGLGMYKLANHLCRHSQTALLLAVSYMLSGFMLSGQLINWLASAAFIPFVILYFLRIHASNRYTNSIKAGIALYFLFTAGYPSFFIITCYILFVLFIFRIADRFRAKSNNQSWTKFLLQYIVMALIFAGLSLPAIVSYIDLLPYYQRGDGLAYNDVIQNSFEWQHLISFFFPSAIKADDIVSGTDISFRNLYIGLFLFPVLAAFPPKLSRRNILLISLGLFALLFSVGDSTPLRKICYQFIPLMDTFRHPAQARLFVIISLLLLAAPSLKKTLNSNLAITVGKKFRNFIWLTMAAIFVVTVIAFMQSGILSQFKGFKLSEAKTLIKNIIDSLSLDDAVAVNGLIQLLFLGGLLWWLRKSTRSLILFSALWIANLFIMAQFVLPLTFVSKTSPAEINALIHESPAGFPVEGLKNTIESNSRDAHDHFDKIALSYFYNKKIGISKVTNSPSFLDEQENFLGNDYLYHYVAGLPVVYIADSVIRGTASVFDPSSTNCNYGFAEYELQTTGVCDSGKAASIKKISANHFEIETKTIAASFLVLTQNYHHHWKATEDGVDKKIYKTNTSFMGIPLSPGNHKLVFRFVPSNTLQAMWIQLSVIILLVLFAGVSLVRKYNSNRRSNP